MLEGMFTGVQSVIWWVVFLANCGVALGLLFYWTPKTGDRLVSMMETAYAEVLERKERVTFREFRQALRKMTPAQELHHWLLSRFVDRHAGVPTQARKLEKQLALAGVLCDFPVLLGILGTLMSIVGSQDIADISVRLGFAVWTTILGIIATLALKATYEWRLPTLESYRSEFHQIQDEVERSLAANTRANNVQAASPEVESL